MRVRPRISLLTALLLMTIFGMAIVLASLWGEVGPLRTRVRQLQDETGRLSIDDPSKIHAIEVRTGEALFWKWRVWVPEGQTVVVRTHWGKVPSSSLPSADGSVDLKPGENWVTMRAHATASGNSWTAHLESEGNGVGMSIPEPDRWWQWPTTSSTESGISYKTKVVSETGPFLLKRFSVSPAVSTNNSSAPSSPMSGFVIWLERSK